MSIEKSYNFIQINKSVSSSGTIKHIDLIDEGIKLVVNLLPDDSEHARTTEEQELESLGVAYKYIPVEWNNPQLADYDVFEKILNQYSGKKIHVHCAANYRATAFYGVYAYKNLGWSKDQVSKLMDSIWNIQEYPLWVKYVNKLMGT